MMTDNGIQFRSAAAVLNYNKMLGCEQSSLEDENEEQNIAPPEPVFEEGERVRSIDNNRQKQNDDSDMPVVIESYSSKVLQSLQICKRRGLTVLVVPKKQSLLQPQRCDQISISGGGFAMQLLVNYDQQTCFDLENN